MGLNRCAPAVFLDKDGTLVENVPFNVDPARVRLLPGVLDGLSRLREAGYRLIVVSNQPGVALGRFPHHALDTLERCLDRLFAAAGVEIDHYAWCPHHPQGTQAAFATACTCRKPQPGLLIGAAARLRLDLAASWMIGDILDDIEAGARAGCRTVLVDGGGETVWRRGRFRTPDAIVHRFDDAASQVLRQGSAAARVGAMAGVGGGSA